MRFLMIFFLAMMTVACFTMTIFTVAYCIDRLVINSWKPVVAAEVNDLKAFLKAHGDVVTVSGLQDEFKTSSGKHVTTYQRVWRTCRFPDGYTIEIEQHHGSPTTRVPMDDEQWRLKISTTHYGAYFALSEKVE